MRLRFWRSAASLAAAVFVLEGCNTVREARIAQAETHQSAGEVKFSNPSLKELVAFALTNRPDMAAAELAVEDARLALRQVSSERHLQAGAGSNYGQSTANGSHWSWHEGRGSFSGSVNAELLIYDFGRIDAREAAARESVVAAEEAYCERAWSVFYEVAGAYFTLLQNDALLDVAHTNETECALHLEQAKNLFEAQEAKKLDVLRAELDLSSAKLSAINASNDVKTAVADLFKALGIEADQARREDILPRRENALDDEETVISPSQYPAVEALAKARGANPSLAVLRAKVEVANQGVNFAIADLYPSLSANAAFNFTDPAWNFNWMAAATQTIFVLREIFFVISSVVRIPFSSGYI